MVNPMNWLEYEALVHIVRENKVADYEDGIKKGDLDGIIAEYIEDEVTKGTIVLPKRVVVDEVAVMTAAEDDRLRHRHPELLRLVIDCLAGRTILGKDDPIFDALALCGGGLRKAWRNVTVDDLTTMIGLKTDHAARAAAAAADFAKDAGAVIAAMARAGALHLEDVLPTPDEEDESC